MAEEKNYSGEVRAIRTLKTDAEIYAARIENSKSELALKGSEHIGFFKNFTGPEHKGLRALVITGTALVLALAGTGLYYLSPEKPAEVKKAPQMPANLIAADEVKIIRLEKADHDNLVRSFSNELLTPFKDGAFKIIIFSMTDNGAVSFLEGSRFFEVSELQAPVILKNSVIAENLGISRSGNAPHPFLIFKIKSGAEALAGMLEWEKTMPNNIRPIFRNTPQFGETNELFADVVVKNQDARVLNFGGSAVLAYAIYNKNFLILTDSDSSLGEIISRYGVFPPKDNQ